MSSLAIGLIVFACVFGGAVVGMVLRSVLPKHHLSDESKDVVKLGTGLIATMAALLLGLLVSSAKGVYDTQSNELTEMSGKILLLDRILAHYGSEARDVRALLRQSVSRAIERLWELNLPVSAPPTAPEAETLWDSIQELVPTTEPQRALQAEAQRLCAELGRTRMLLFAQQSSSISLPFLIVVVCWIAIIFASFGLFAPRNLTVITTLFLCALSVSGAIFLIVELNYPFRGLMQLSSAPLRNVLAVLGS